jgi:hypothetical protein
MVCCCCVENAWLDAGGCDAEEYLSVKRKVSYRRPSEQEHKVLGGAMPLKKGSSQKTISENISELEHSKTKAGKKRSHKQNIAIAMAEARKSKGGK